MQLGIVPDRWCWDLSRIRGWHQNGCPDWKPSTKSRMAVGKWMLRQIHMKGMAGLRHSGSSILGVGLFLVQTCFEKSVLRSRTTFFLQTLLFLSITHFFLLNWSSTISIHVKPAPVLVNFHIAFRWITWITMLLLKLIQFLDEKGPMFSSPNISVFSRKNVGLGDVPLRSCRFRGFGKRGDGGMGRIPKTVREYIVNLSKPQKDQQFASINQTLLEGFCYFYFFPLVSIWKCNSTFLASIWQHKGNRIAPDWVECHSRITVFPPGIE